MPPKKRGQKAQKDMTAAELKAECQRRGLDDSGSKKVLLARLEAGGDEEPPPKLQKVASEGTIMKQAFAALKDKPKTKRKPKVDQFACCHNFKSHSNSDNIEVFEDYDCMLNQTNVGKNNNKFYIIQLLTDSKQYWNFTRWGRVGENGENNLNEAKDLDTAVKEFKKKFRDKTKNAWESREEFTPAAGKYTLLEMDDDDDDEVDGKEESNDKQTSLAQRKAKELGVAPSKLDPKTLDLIDMLFDLDMFQNAMADLELDVKKMPLGKLSKSQISKGFDALIALEDAIKAKKSNKILEELTSQFYTLIPHNFGRQRPPVINSPDVIRKKKDILLVLSDIELTQSMQKEERETRQNEKGLKPNPVDAKYELLNCKLELLSTSSDEFKKITKYIESTAPTHLKLDSVWRVDRDGERERHRQHDQIDNRRLLWHGTNVAVVAAILKTGLRIMPHSGGRVGKGIYLASENSKSAGYVSPTTRGNVSVGVMFLAEAALGKENHIKRDNGSLTKPPNGFDSVIARGHTEPDPKHDTSLILDGKKVAVPQGKPVKVPEFKDSSFWQSEYLLYSESQVRLRYLLTFHIDYGRWY